jgi:hypothetical protein
MLGESENHATPKMLTGCIEYLGNAELSKRFDLHRHNFIAHASSAQPSAKDIVDFSHIFRVVPKMIHLVELINDRLGRHPLHFSYPFKGIARELCAFFSQSQSDNLLAEVFANRSLPNEEFEAAVNTFQCEPGAEASIQSCDRRGDHHTESMRDGPTYPRSGQN